MADIDFGIKLTIDDDGYLTWVKKSTGETKRLMKATDLFGQKASKAAQSGGSGVRDFAKEMITALATAKALQIAFDQMKQSVEKAGAFEVQELQIKQFIGSMNLAHVEMARLAKFSASTPFKMPGIAKADRLLLSFGGTVLATQDNLRTVGDAAAATGEPLENMSMWFGRAYAAIQAGAPLGEVNERMREWGILSSTTMKKIELLKQAGAGSDVIWKTWLTQWDKSKGAMKELSETFEGRVSTMQDLWDEFQRTVGQNGPLQLAKESVKLINAELVKLLSNTGKTQGLGEKIVDFAVGTAEFGLKLERLWYRLRIGLTWAMGTIARAFKLGQLGLNRLNQFRNYLWSFVMNTIGAFLRTGTEFLGALMSLPQNAFREFNAWVGRMLGNVMAGLGGLVRDLAGLVDRSGMAGAFVGQLDAMAKGLEKFGERAKIAMEQSIGKDTFGDKYAKFGEKLGKEFEGMGQMFGDSAEKAAQAARDAGEEIAILDSVVVDLTTDLLDSIEGSNKASKSLEEFKQNVLKLTDAERKRRQDAIKNGEAELEAKRKQAAEDNKRSAEFQKLLDLAIKGQKVFKDLQGPQVEFTEKVKQLTAAFQVGRLSFWDYTAAIARLQNQLVRSENAAAFSLIDGHKSELDGLLDQYEMLLNSWDEIKGSVSETDFNGALEGLEKEIRKIAFESSTLGKIWGSLKGVFSSVVNDLANGTFTMQSLFQTILQTMLDMLMQYVTNYIENLLIMNTTQDLIAQKEVTRSAGVTAAKTSEAGAKQFSTWGNNPWGIAIAIGMIALMIAQMRKTKKEARDIAKVEAFEFGGLIDSEGFFYGGEGNKPELVAPKRDFIAENRRIWDAELSPVAANLARLRDLSSEMNGARLGASHAGAFAGVMKTINTHQVTQVKEGHSFHQTIVQNGPSFGDRREERWLDRANRKLIKKAGL